MSKYVTTNRVWQISACYLGIIALLDFFHVQYNYLTGEILFHPFVSILVIVEIILIVLLTFKTKLGYLLTVVYLLLLTLIKTPQLLTMRSFMKIMEVQEINTLHVQINLFVIVISMSISLILTICLLAKKSSRNEVKQVNWILPSFFQK